MFPQLKKKIEEAEARLEQQLVRSDLPLPLTDCSTNAKCQEQDKGPGDQSTPEDITKAKEAIASAKTAIRESS